MTTDATAALTAAVADTDAALARLEDIAGRLGDGDLCIIPQREMR